MTLKEKPVFSRLSFSDVSTVPAPAVNAGNREARDLMLKKSQDSNDRIELRDCISDTQDDVVLSEIYRYGLPVRTVLNRKIGLLRTDPYYSESWLNAFYTTDYRP